MSGRGRVPDDDGRFVSLDTRATAAQAMQGQPAPGGLGQNVLLSRLRRQRHEGVQAGRDPGDADLGRPAGKLGDEPVSPLPVAKPRAESTRPRSARPPRMFLRAVLTRFHE
ncbi:MAG: hypothetical protein ACRDOK_30190 [Streptosporangiaceae bacterium]